MKDTVINIVLFVVALMIVVVATRSIAPNLNEKNNDDYSVISQRTILDSVTEKDIYGKETVRYTYLGDVVPPKLDEQEVVSLRTASSYSTQVGIENEGTPDENVLVETRVYPQQAFIQRDNQWYYIEHDEAPLSEFNKYTKKGLFSWLVTDVAEAVSGTFYSGAGDGYLGRAGQVSWADTHDSAAGTIVSTTTPTVYLAYVAIFTYKSTTTWTIYRSAFSFDTSSIPSDATITSASLNVTTSTASSDGDNDGQDYLTVVETSQASHTDLVLADYNNIGDTVTNPTEGINVGQRKDLTGMASGTVLTFTLNATGLSWIKKSGQASSCSGTAGITCLGIREGHDTTNNEVVGVNYVFGYTSENSGTASDPYLSVAYTVPARYAFWMFSDF